MSSHVIHNIDILMRMYIFSKEVQWHNEQGDSSGFYADWKKNKWKWNRNMVRNSVLLGIIQKE